MVVSGLKNIRQVVYTVVSLEETLTRLESLYAARFARFPDEAPFLTEKQRE